MPAKKKTKPKKTLTPRTAQKIMDDAIRAQVYLERVKAGMVGDYMQAYAKVERATVRILRDLESDNLGDLSRQQLDQLVQENRAAMNELLAKQNTKLVEQLHGVSAFSMEREVRQLNSWASELVGERFVMPNAKEAWKEVQARPIKATGQNIDGFLDSYKESAIKRAEGAIRNGWAEGKTIGQVTTELVGTKSQNYRDGLGFKSRREAETVVRTATQSVANTSRQLTWEENDDVVVGYIWISTLDGHTTTQCRSLDKKRFKLGKGPVPPIHYNCRSTTIADLGPQFDFLDKGATRSAEGGYVSGDLTYYDWLKTQDKEFVVDALGAKRAQLFTSGGLTTDEFAKLNLGKDFKPLTLEEMKQKDAAAFERAGLD
jgi:SPP1 gp7 family putative phage head morphogenesis protein